MKLSVCERQKEPAAWGFENISSGEGDSQITRLLITGQGGVAYFYYAHQDFIFSFDWSVSIRQAMPFSSFWTLSWSFYRSPTSPRSKNGQWWLSDQRSHRESLPGNSYSEKAGPSKRCQVGWGNWGLRVLWPVWLVISSCGPANIRCYCKYLSL